MHGFVRRDAGRRRMRVLGRAVIGSGRAPPSPRFAEALEPRMFLTATPAGGEFHANTFVANTQSFPATAMDADGDFVVAWETYGQGANIDVFAQRYNNAGMKQGNEFPVNTVIAANQTKPAVAMDDSGDFVIAWEAPDANGPGVFARRYNAAGAAQGGEIPVNTHTLNGQKNPSIAMDADGDFVIAWQSSNQDAPASYGVYAQRFNAAGMKQGGEFPANTTTASNQWYPTTAMDASGDFVIAWSSDLQDPDASTGIYARRYNAAGMAQGGEIPVNAFTAGDQGFASAAMDDDGDFVIAWHGNGLGDTQDGIFAQRFNAAGMTQGVELRANTHTAGRQKDPAVAMDADGDFVVTWQSYYQDPNSGLTGIYAQRYNAGGVRRDSEFRANATTANDQKFPAAAMEANGDFVIAWASDDQDPPDGRFQFGVYGQRYSVSDGPELTSASFVFQTLPHGLSYTFNQNVGASLAAADLSVVKLGFGGGPVAFTAPTYTAGNNTGIFGFSTAMLPEGNYRATLTAAGVRNAANVPLAADHVLDFHVLLGDASRDRTVGFADLVVLAQNYGAAAKNYSQGNFNYDAAGTVNFQDLVILAQNYGRTLPQQGAAVIAGPAPSLEQVMADRRRPPDRIFNAIEPVRRPKPRRP